MIPLEAIPLPAAGDDRMAIVHVYTGNGGGKTTAALGVSMRALGHGKRVVFVQFMKGRQTGEFLIKNRLPGFEIKQFGRKDFIDLDKPLEEDIALAEKGLEFVRRSLENPPFLLVLDELNLAISCGLVKVHDVLELLENIPPELHVIVTGRNAPKEMTERADFVTELSDTKSPEEAYPAREGIEY